jgi:hypothetical protein
MMIIRPVDVTPAMLTSSNVQENDFDVWSVSTAYTVGQKVTLNRRNYEALVANTGANPETDTSDPPKWLDLGATNRWRMFDDSVGSLTEFAGSVDVVLQPNAVIN